MKWSLTQDKILTNKQADLLFKEQRRELDNAVSSKRDLKFINDYFISATLYNTGLRVSELCDLNWKDVFDDYLVVRSGKGGKPRTVHFGGKTLALFEEFRELQCDLFDRACKPTDSVFLGQRGKLTRSGIHGRVKYWFNRLNFPAGLSSHSFRHGFATRLLNAGIDLASVRELLGHSNISTTSTYLHFTEASKDKIRRLL